MKKLSIIAIVALVLVFTLNTDAKALTLVGLVTPVFNADNISGIATYQVTLFADPGDAVTSINFFSMDFLTSAFSSASLLSGPAGLTLTGLGVDALSWGSFFGPPIVSVGNTFTFSVGFTLTNPTTSPLYNSVLMWGATNVAWNQNQDGFGGTLPAGPFGSAGGSTGITPEPGTLILLGIGLIGAGASRRFRRKRKIK